MFNVTASMKSVNFDKFRRRTSTDPSYSSIRLCVAVAVFASICVIIYINFLYFLHSLDIPKVIHSNVVQTFENRQNSSIIEHTSSDVLSVTESKISEFKAYTTYEFLKTQSVDFHFIHIPKCGGTSMTAVLRQMTCHLNQTRNADCCLNPGFCDWWAHRRCTAIKGCISHFPNRELIFMENIPSITLMRDPVSRHLSAFYYRCHSPNNDCFQVRPYFKKIREGILPKVTFSEYIEMIEYQNIQTRMLGANSQPYTNITIDEKVYQQAVDALNHIFFIGLQEVYEISVHLLLRELHIDQQFIKNEIIITKERSQTSPVIRIEKQKLIYNKKLMKRVKEVNSYDVLLYELAKIKFCTTLKKYQDLWERVQQDGDFKC